MKTCRTCSKELPLDAFYRHPKASDGLHGSCKECVKARARAYRAANLERVRQYDRERGQIPERKERVKATYRKRVSDPERRRAEWDRKNASGRKDPERYRARVAVRTAIRDGRLKVCPCERCGYAVGVHAHHEDYSKPLEVTWLCRPCHGARHREINAERRQRRAA